MRLPLAVPAAALLLLAACASGPEQDQSPPRPAPGPRATRSGPPAGGARGAGCGPLFVSPAGEPFRAGPDAPVCPLRAWFARADADGDGALSRTEFRDDALRFFAVLDADGNGYVDGLELQAYEHRIAPEILGRGGGPRAAVEARPRLLPAAMQMGGGGGMGGQGGLGGGGRGGRGGGGPSIEGGGSSRRGLEGGGGLARFGLLGEPEPVAAADLDLDGRITRVEFATRADQRFRSLDEAEAARLTYPDLERRLRGQGRRGAGQGGGGAPDGGRRGGRGGRGGGGRSGGGFGGPPQA